MGIGVKSGEEVAKCKMVICDPSYCTADKRRAVGRVIRCICILGAPIPNTNNNQSCQLIIPQKELKRNSDIFVSMVSWAHCVAHKDKYIAIVSAKQETEDPAKEIEPALKLLGPIENRFMNISELFMPTDDGSKDQVFVTSSYDELSHFETATDDVLQLWKQITGSDLDLNLTPEEMAEDS